MRFAIFVDGSNLIGSLSKIRVNVGDYQSFYKHIINNALDDWRECAVGDVIPFCQLLRVFWYQVGDIDNINLDSDVVRQNLQNVFERSKDINKFYMALAGRENPRKNKQEIKKIAWEMCFSDSEEWYESKCDFLYRMRAFNSKVQSETHFIEIIESGHWKVNFLGRQVSEKGIDTSLAVDLVTLIDSYDIALVVSGDADMIPSIKYAKQRGKQVGVIEFIGGYPPEKKRPPILYSLKESLRFYSSSV